MMVMKEKVIIRVFLFMVLFLSHNSFGQENLEYKGIPMREVNSREMNLPLVIDVYYVHTSGTIIRSSSVKIRVVAYFYNVIGYRAYEYDMGSFDHNGDMRSFALIGDPDCAKPEMGYMGEITSGDRVLYYYVQLCIKIGGYEYYTPVLDHVIGGHISYEFYDMIGGGIGCQTVNPIGVSGDIHSVGHWILPGRWGM